MGTGLDSQDYKNITFDSDVHNLNGVNYSSGVVNFSDTNSLIAWTSNLTPSRYKHLLRIKEHHNKEFMDFWNACIDLDVTINLAGGEDLNLMHAADFHIVKAIEMCSNVYDENNDMKNKHIKALACYIGNTKLLYTSGKREGLAYVYHLVVDDMMNVLMLESLIEKYTKFEKYEICDSLSKIKNSYASKYGYEHLSEKEIIEYITSRRFIRDENIFNEKSV